MMTAIVQCPNSACGRFSHLGDDPLGRIFRCPHCLTKLPSAPATAADSGWTAVVGPPRLGSRRLSFRSIHTLGWAQPTPLPAASHAWNSPATSSGEVLVGAVRNRRCLSATTTIRSHSGLGPDDSGEVLIEPFFSDGRSGSVMGGCIDVVESQSAVGARVRSGAQCQIWSQRRELSWGDFEFWASWGKGEHATVYRAYDPILERDVALKVPRQGVLKTAKALDRFLGEAKALARLRHPRIVPVYEAGCAGERHYIAMALIEGHSLAERLAERPFALHRAAEIVAELAEALAYAHSSRGRPPRCQACQRPPRRPRRRLPHGLRHCLPPRLGRGPTTAWHDPRHASVSRPRAGSGGTDRRATGQRPVQLGRGLL